MANIIKNGPQPVKVTTSNIFADTTTVDKRTVVDLLPAVNQTETLTKFFNATVDHLMQPENVEFISGYIGTKPAYYDSKKDFYIAEATQDRINYQLPVTAVSNDPSSGTLNNVMFYDDMINQLALQGANTKNPSRLLEGEYYSWLPPVDPDKFINFYEYYWLPNGPSVIQLLDPTNLNKDAAGNLEFVYTGTYYRTGDQQTITGTLKFTSGLRIQAMMDADPAFNDIIYIVENVGTGIKIEPDYVSPNPGWDIYRWSIRGWDGDNINNIADYMTIARLSKNFNRWSINNRWFHKDVILLSGNNLFDIESRKASRPIIEFNSEIQIYNFGTYGRPDVDIVDTFTVDIFAELAGKPTIVDGEAVSYTLDGVNIVDGVTILVTADQNSTVNNRVYRVGGMEEFGTITLTLETTGQNPTGAPAYGDCTFSVYGTANGQKSWWYNGTKWVVGQAREKYVPPVFEAYDADGNNLRDPVIYPASNFAGTHIFTYATDSNSLLDSVLNIRAKKDQFGDYLFDNELTTKTYTYIENGIQTNISGYVWYQIESVLGNSWYKSRGASRQYIFNSFDINLPTTTFLIDQTPGADRDGYLPTIIVYLINGGRANLLVKGKDYRVTSRIVTLTSAAPEGSRVEIYSWSSELPVANNGYYKQPINLVSNPNNEQPTVVNFNQTLNHFASLISNQSGETSNGIGSTGWRDRSKILGLGTYILQHRSPLLKLMMLNSTNINSGPVSSMSLTDPSLAIQFAQREYTRFYTRFLRVLFNLYNTQGYDLTTPLQAWISAALKQVNLAKSKVNSWAYSGYEQNEDFTSTGNPTFVPPTAAKLSAAPVYKPVVWLDFDYYPPKLTLQTHDGARIIMEDLEGNPLGTIDKGQTITENPALLTHPVAGAWLQFELNLYNGIPNAYKDIDSLPAFDQRAYRPGKWRNSLENRTEYSRAEYLEILRPSFDKWVIQTQVDWSANTTYSQNNQFSLNYSTCVDYDGQSVPGHWRAMYVYFYDTDRPHTHPWEMLGFTQKPTWWDAQYGAAPYTRGNTNMWEDLRDGLIRQGSRAGYHPTWSRPGLMSCIPVDEQGNLLPPFGAGIVVSIPSVIDARADWKFGDGGPVENVWLHSLEFGYVVALTSYLMKPARFIEQCWDPLRTAKVGEGDSRQYVYIDTNRRRSSSEFYVHRENPASIGGSLSIPNETELSFFGSWGIQHWVSEYLVSQNLSVTNNLGKIIRGSYSSLAHKFGGFVSTDNSLRVMADSFGQLGYTSQLVPSENIRTYIYKSIGFGTFFYGGVIVVKQSNGWKVYGYDGVTPVFTTIPSVVNGPKASKVIGNITVVEYQTGQGLATVPYGTVFETRQDVYDFIISYGRYLESQGWVFDNINDDNNKVINWKQSARDFVYWSQGNWSNGSFVALSPNANNVKFKKAFGSVQYVNGTIGGTYPVIDKAGQPIESQNIEVLRQNDEIVIRPINNQSVYGLRLFVTSLEHIMIVDNVTQFNDLIYDPLYTIYQPRLKVYGYRTNGWTGRLDAPGYFLYQDPVSSQWTMIPNLDKTSADFRNLYNIDQPKNVINIDNTTGLLVEKPSTNHAVTRTDLSSLAKHLIGYQKRDYLENLLLDETTQFEFYQGMIRQKGTRRAFDNMLRNLSMLGAGTEVNYYEEYAFRKSRYGAVSLNSNIDFIVPQAECINNPQQINVFSQYASTQPRDGTIEIAIRDANIVVPPENYEGKLFALRPTANSFEYGDLPTSGYVILGEATYNVVDTEELYALGLTLLNEGSVLKTGDKIWQFVDDKNSWNIYKVVDPTSKVTGSTVQGAVNATDIAFEYNHGIVVGDLVYLSGFVNNASLNGTFVVTAVTENTITVPISTFIEESTGTVQVFRSLRYHSKPDIPITVLGGWQQEDLIYVDNGETKGEWTVYRFNVGQWTIYRSAQPKVDADLILSSKLYSKVTFEDLLYLEYYDPAKGIIPGIAERELSYKSVYDPAQYNQGDTSVYTLNSDACWAESHIGEVWWDLSTTRFIDYEQGSLDYRSKNWGKITPGTTIDIYEWIKSPIPPSDWANYASSGLILAQLGIDYVPSGTVKNGDNPAWTERVEYDQNGNGRTWYYFWVKNSEKIPSYANRKLSTSEIARLILDPSSSSISWFAVISERSLLVANIKNKLNANDVVMQVVYTTKANSDNDYKEWTLIRKGDPISYIDSEYWDRIRASLTGFDSMGNQVPDPLLNELVRYGNLIRPRQSWFKDRLDALSIFVNKINNQLASSSDPLVLDSTKTKWTLYFNQNEPIPPAKGNWEYQVSDLSELEQLKESAINGERALVLPNAANRNMWSIYQWDESSSDFILSRKQAYSVTDFWKFVDWYYTGFNETIIPTYTVNTIEEKDAIDLTQGETIKVLNYPGYGWALFSIVDGVERLVGFQDGTIQITDNLWKTSLNSSGFDTTSLDSMPFDYNPTVEIGLIFDGVVYGIYSDSGKRELNDLFFTMVNYVLNEHTYVDWVFKTSFISINGSMEPLGSSELYRPNTVDLLLDYVNEIKPYRSKVREFVSSRTSRDNVIVSATDFDKPVYKGRVLSDLDLADQNLMANSTTFAPWFNNYKTNGNLIRRLKTQLVFDRVTSMPKITTLINAVSYGSTVTFNIKSDVTNKLLKVGQTVTITNVITSTTQVSTLSTNNAIVTGVQGNVLIVDYNRELGHLNAIGGQVSHRFAQEYSILTAQSSGNIASFTVNLAATFNSFRVGETVSVSDVRFISNGSVVTSLITSNATVLEVSGNVVVAQYSNNIGNINGYSGSILHNFEQAVSVINAHVLGSNVNITTNTILDNAFINGEQVIVAFSQVQPGTVGTFNTFDAVIKSIQGNVVVADYGRDIGIGNGYGGAMFHPVSGAADRIIKYYSPQDYMPPSFSPDLISGTDYKGIIFSGGGLNMEPGWDIAPWDFAAGWDADRQAFDAFIEIILEGGMPPVYDIFYGDSNRTQFKLNKVPQDLYGSKVWSDGILQTYGVDYTVPNFATKLTITIGGTGYKIGDTLKLKEDSATPNAVMSEFTVASISPQGAIRTITITNPGYFDVVQNDPYDVEYIDPYNAGTGTGARIAPVWGGNTLKFTTPPNASVTPNIWVLYAGTTFEPAPAGEYDTITDGNNFIQPYEEQDHAEELYINRARDAIRIDTWSLGNGGMPTVSLKYYITEGIKDHYDIGLRPQTDSGVIAYLDGVVLRQGANNDYVINFETNELIFLVPPVPGKWLTITAFGEGGSGNTIAAAYPVNKGTGYRPQNVITLEGGVPTQFSGGGRYRARLVVETVTAVNLTITSGGAGYKTNEILQLDLGNVPEQLVPSRLLIKATKVSRLGEVLTATIVNAGSYKSLPTTYSWSGSNSKGSGLQITPIWGVNTTTVQSPGLYTVKPTEPFTQYSVSPIGGTGATFNVNYTNILNQQMFTGDGVTDTFNLVNGATSVDNIFVTVNGVPQVINAFTSTSVTIDTPAFGAYVLITIFNTPQFSYIVSNEIYALGEPSFLLSNFVGNTVPSYSTLFVTRNGVPINPPKTEIQIGDGFTSLFDVSNIPTDLSYFKIYVDESLVIPYNYAADINTNTVQFYYFPPNGSTIVFQNVDPANGPTYEMIGPNEITFYGLAFGDRMNVTSYSQDLAYKMIIETFAGTTPAEYELEATPSTENSLTVTVNGVIQRMMWDYRIVKRDKDGYELFTYDTRPYNVGPIRYFIVFGLGTTHTPTDQVVVRYARGLEERLPTGFRQFIDSNMFRQSQVLGFDSRTTLLSNVYLNSSNIEVADYTVLTQPTLGTPGSIWINNEKIEFFELQPKPTSQYPNKGRLTNLVRGVGGTSYSPEIVYNSEFFNGNAANIYFATPSGYPTNGLSVLVNGKLQGGGHVSWYQLNGSTNSFTVPVNILGASAVRVYSGATQESLLLYSHDWYIGPNNTIVLDKTWEAGTIIRVEVDAVLGNRSAYYLGQVTSAVVSILGVSVGWYVIFDLLNIPPVGWKNVKLVERVTTSTTLCHSAGTVVQDAGTNTLIPGGYSWEPNADGLQYSSTEMAKFILEHPGTPY